ncbi:unnamed protein product [Caenorhabditis sp. 36 PRJEB53466]|nr:unnamed protein product [Caenorhabditis sp. 36 PRJEB53466]
MLQTFTLALLLVAVVAQSVLIEKTPTSDGTQPILNTDLALLGNDVQSLSLDLTQEGQSSDVVVRAKRYYGCGCGCGCATVAAVSAAPCGYGCCGCGYGK